jgi:hypothetical protein
MAVAALARWRDGHGGGEGGEGGEGGAGCAACAFQAHGSACSATAANAAAAQGAENADAARLASRPEKGRDKTYGALKLKTGEKNDLSLRVNFAEEGRKATQATKMLK